jgi:hypothetical protein
MDKRSTYRRFAVLAIAFLFGSITGAFTGRSVPSDAISGVLSPESSFGQLLFSLALFPAIAVLLGTSLLGGILLPVLSGAKGFTLSFSLSVLFSTYSNSAEKWQVIRLRAIPTLISVSIMFVLATQALHSSMTLFKLGVRATVTDRLYPSRYWVNVLVCTLVIIITAVFSVLLNQPPK